MWHYLNEPEFLSGAALAVWRTLQDEIRFLLHVLAKLFGGRGKKDAARQAIKAAKARRVRRLSPREMRSHELIRLWAVILVLVLFTYRPSKAVDAAEDYMEKVDVPEESARTLSLRFWAARRAAPFSLTAASDGRGSGTVDDEDTDDDEAPRSAA